MTRKTRIRVSGLVQHLSRGPAIVTDEGDTWIIEMGDKLELPSVGHVVLEGVQAGLDRLKVDWIGENPLT